MMKQNWIKFSPNYFNWREKYLNIKKFLMYNEKKYVRMVNDFTSVSSIRASSIR